MHHPPAPRREQRAVPDRTKVERFSPTPGDLDVVGVTEAAAMLGLTRQRIFQYVADGRLVTAEHRGERWTIARAEIDWLLS